MTLLDSPIPGVTLKTISANGITMRYAEAGSGPLVLFCHGWPESWYSWRHQIAALSAAGFRCVAPDMRGYGGTDAPAEIEHYTLLHIVGDMVELVKQLGETQAVIVGHDWGAPAAWNSALLRPDVFRAVVGMSVPFAPPGRVELLGALAQQGIQNFYMQYFQAPGVAEAELQRDVRSTMRRMAYSGSGDAPRPGAGGAPSSGIAMVARTGGFLDHTTDPAALPAWIGEADIDFYTKEFARTGFRGGLNWYRNIDRNWELLAPYAGALVTVPALYVVGDRDLVFQFRGMDQLIPNLSKFVPNLRRTIVLPGCGHWTQQERARDVNAAILEFLKGLGAS